MNNMGEKNGPANSFRRELSKCFYRNNTGRLILAAAMIAFMGLCDLAFSYLLMLIINVAAGDELRPLTKITLLCVIIFIAYILAYAIYRVTISRFIRNAVRQYKEYVFEELLKKNISTFISEDTGKYLSALTNDVTSIETNYLSKIFALIMQLLTFFGALVMMLYQSWQLTIIAILLSIIPIVATLISGTRLADMEKEVSVQNEGFMGSLKDLLSGFSVIKSFKAETEAMEQFKNSNTNIESVKYTRRMTEKLVDMLGVCAGMFAQFGVFILGAYISITSDMVEPGVTILFMQLMNYVINPINTVPSILANRKASKALIEKLAGSLKENIHHGGINIGNNLSDCIEIKNLSFAYEKGNDILNNISVKFEHGKSYAIVGNSGCGKSTLLNLLMNSYENYEGSICYDGADLHSIDSDSLYNLISLVQQNVFVFNSTIRNNITMFRNYDDEKVKDAVKISGLEELIELKGMDYMCGEGGKGLSGGERQRLSIARCLLQGASVLLLDEVTASLDAVTAYEVTSSILNMENCTRIAVTHRLEEQLLSRYDEIIVMRGGKICEKGGFYDLMERKGYFYSLYTVSSGGSTL